MTNFKTYFLILINLFASNLNSNDQANLNAEHIDPAAYIAKTFVDAVIAGNNIRSAELRDIELQNNYVDATKHMIIGHTSCPKTDCDGIIIDVEIIAYGIYECRPLVKYYCSNNH